MTRPGGSRGGAGLHRGTWEPVCPEDLKPNTLEEMVGGAQAGQDLSVAQGLMPPHTLVYMGLEGGREPRPVPWSASRA